MVLACLVLAGSNFRASARFLLTSHLRLPSRMHSKENSPVSLLLLGLELALCCLAMNLVVAHDNPSDLLLPPSDVTALPSCFAQSEPGEGTSTSNESIARRIDSDLVDCCKVGSSLVSEYIARESHDFVQVLFLFDPGEGYSTLLPLLNPSCGFGACAFQVFWWIVLDILCLQCLLLASFVPLVVQQWLEFKQCLDSGGCCCTQLEDSLGWPCRSIRSAQLLCGTVFR